MMSQDNANQRRFSRWRCSVPRISSCSCSHRFSRFFRQELVRPFTKKRRSDVTRHAFVTDTIHWILLIRFQILNRFIVWRPWIFCVIPFFADLLVLSDDIGSKSSLHCTFCCKKFVSMVTMKNRFVKSCFVITVFDAVIDSASLLMNSWRVF